MAPRAGEGPGSSTGPDGLPGASPARPTSASRRAAGLLDSGNTHAAVVALERARDLEPDKGSIREALARAYFRTQRIDAARAEFEKVLELDPVNDYAHFGLGLCLLRVRGPGRGPGPSQDGHDHAARRRGLPGRPPPGVRLVPSANGRRPSSSTSTVSCGSATSRCPAPPRPWPGSGPPGWRSGS